MSPQWWDEMEAVASEDHCRWSAAWYSSMRDQYLARFPAADERSKANMRSFVDQAAAREPGQGVLDFGGVA